MVYNPSDHPRAPKGTPQGGQFTAKPGVGGDNDLTDIQPDEKFVSAQPSLPFNLDVNKYATYPTSTNTIRKDFAHLLADSNPDISESQALDWVNRRHQDVYQYMVLRELADQYHIQSVDPHVVERMSDYLQTIVEEDSFSTKVQTMDDIQAQVSGALYMELNDALGDQAYGNYYDEYGETSYAFDTTWVLPEHEPVRGDASVGNNQPKDGNILTRATVTPIFLTKEGAQRVREVGYKQAFAETELARFAKE